MTESGPVGGRARIMKEIIIQRRLIIVHKLRATEICIQLSLLLFFYHARWRQVELFPSLTPKHGTLQDFGLNSAQN